MTILYVNGDSHSAGAEAVNNYCFAEDDPLYYALGRRPHPDNERASYGCELANMMNAILECDAESASSNHRIIRTTWDYLKEYKPDYVVIGWSTWERKEFYDKETGKTWQVNAGGVGADWPEWLKNQYPTFIAEIDWDNEMQNAHRKIHQFHLDLKRNGVNHVFFNTYNHFDADQLEHQYTWDQCYIEPYNKSMTYYNWCIQKGFSPVKTDSYHFGSNAHSAWAEFLYQHISHNHLTKK